MTRFAAAVIFAAFAISVTAASAKAGPISRACLSSDRAGANRTVCGCIQQAADRTLTRNDQRLAAKFFKEPDMAQEVRMSKSAQHNAFWDRYKQFGAFAEATCS